MKRKITDNGPAIFALIDLDTNPANGSRSQKAGQAGIYYEHNRACTSGVFTLPELQERAKSIPILNISDCTVSALFNRNRLPIREQAAYLMEHGADLINNPEPVDPWRAWEEKNGIKREPLQPDLFDHGNGFSLTSD